MPILVAELPKLLPHYVLAFLLAEKFRPIAILGLSDNQNSYVGVDGRWMCEYAPAAVRSYPFEIADAGQGEKVLCILEQYLSAQEYGKGHRLFDNDGALNSSVQEIFEFLQTCDKERGATDTAVNLLEEAGLLEKWELGAVLPDSKEELLISGLYRINESKLFSLDAEIFADLRRYGAIQLAYAQLFSMAQVPNLCRRVEHQANETAQSSVTSEFILSSNNSTINFDLL